MLLLSVLFTLLCDFRFVSYYILFISACGEALLVPVLFVVLRFEVVGLNQGISIWQVGHGGIAFDQCLAGRPAVVYASVIAFRLLI